MKKKILFVLPTLTAGGAERVISFISQNINKKKYDAKLLVTGHKKDAAYEIENIEVKFLEKRRVLNAVPNIFWYLIKQRPNVVLSSIGHLNIVMGLMSPLIFKTKFIIREASVISLMGKIHNESTTNKTFNIYSFLSRRSFRMVDKIICQSKDMADDFTNIYNVKKQNVVIINNPITNFHPLKETNTDSSKAAKFITVGRLSKEKGQLRVIELLSKLKFPFHYTIIGDGPLKDTIFEAIKLNHLEDRFTYIPFTNEVSKHIAANDMFLQGSYVEGFPNTVLESCFVGTPVLAFNVPGGTKEIIQHQVNGYLVENKEEYFYYLNNRLPLKPQKVRASVETKFDKKTIIKQYESLFEQL
ncbi:glycosyltransferase [Algibacter luteus]|uniref:Glycosyltransferase involved in cell wall bisynthesis n=1 Tax=Algibacter luteus TaxID=1178825 RepID=A0A1M6GPH0_9FLAO|nr:glycosyltransferase [Algibacter luteus]SHJ11853.1 Glycosyltransferase involved in cell wall bisynthesis [Algibacter luteus]